MVLLVTISRIGIFLSANDSSSLAGSHLIPKILTIKSLSSTPSMAACVCSALLFEFHDRRLLPGLDIKLLDSVKYLSRSDSFLKLESTLSTYISHLRIPAAGMCLLLSKCLKMVALSMNGEQVAPNNTNFKRTVLVTDVI